MEKGESLDLIVDAACESSIQLVTKPITGPGGAMKVRLSPAYCKDSFASWDV